MAPKRPIFNLFPSWSVRRANIQFKRNFRHYPPRILHGPRPVFIDRNILLGVHSILFWYNWLRDSADQRSFVSVIIGMSGGATELTELSGLQSPFPLPIIAGRLLEYRRANQIHREPTPTRCAFSAWSLDLSRQFINSLSYSVGMPRAYP